MLCIGTRDPQFTSLACDLLLRAICNVQSRCSLNNNWRNTAMCDMRWSSSRIVMSED